jgi:hypothetical protein
MAQAVISNGEDGAAVRAKLNAVLVEARSVKDAGAVGDGVADDSAAIQTAMTTRQRVFLPNGTYSFDTPLSWSAAAPVSGVTFEGEGAQFSDAIEAPYANSGTVCRWDGTVGATMFELPGALGVIMRGFTILGKTDGAATNTAGIGVLLSPVVGYGNGGHSFEYMSYQYLNVAIQIMEAEGDSNGDTTNINQVGIIECDRGLVAKNDQALGIFARQLNATKVRSVIHLEHGGHLQFDGGNMNECGSGVASAWLTATAYVVDDTVSNGSAVYICTSNHTSGASTEPGVGGSWATVWDLVGDNSFCIRVDDMDTNTHTALINSLKIENNTKGAGYFSGFGKVLINCFDEAQGDQNCRQWYVKGPVVEWVASRFVSQDATVRAFYFEHNSGRIGAGIFRGCNFPGTSFNFADHFEVEVNTVPWFKFENCTYGTNDTPIPDFASQLEWGPVLHYGQTPSNSAQNLHLDGIATENWNNSIAIPDDTAWVVDVYFVGKQASSANYATFHRRVSIVDNGGTTTMSAVQTVGTDVNVPTWSVDVGLSGNHPYARVTGGAGVTVDWTATFVGRRVG